MTGIFKLFATIIWEPIIIVLAVGFAFEHLGMYADTLVGYALLAVFAIFLGSVFAGLFASGIGYTSRKLVEIQQ